VAARSIAIGQCAVEVELVRGRAGWLPWRGLVAVAWGGGRGVGWLPWRGAVAVASAAWNRETAAVIQRSIHFYKKEVDHGLAGADHIPDRSGRLAISQIRC